MSTKLRTSFQLLTYKISGKGAPSPSCRNHLERINQDNQMRNHQPGRASWTAREAERGVKRVTCITAFNDIKELLKLQQSSPKQSEWAWICPKKPTCIEFLPSIILYLKKNHVKFAYYFIIKLNIFLKTFEQMLCSRKACHVYPMALHDLPHSILPGTHMHPPAWEALPSTTSH